MDSGHYSELLGPASTFMAHGSSAQPVNFYFLAKSQAQTAVCNNLASPAPFPASGAYLYGYTASNCTEMINNSAYLSYNSNRELKVYQSGGPAYELWHVGSPSGSYTGIDVTTTEDYLEMYMR
jgi:hypothetical protein